LEKKLLDGSALETADRGRVTGAILAVFWGNAGLVLYLAFRDTLGDPGNLVGMKFSYSLILTLGIAQPGLLLPLPKSGL
jgi:hypothetical protein